MTEKPKFIVRDGMVLEPGSEAWHWWRANRQRLEGINPQAINPHHPHAPKSHPLTVKPKRPHPAASLDENIVRIANRGLLFAGRMTYSEGADREMLFDRKRGDFLDAHADCSQFCASDLHWLGVKSLTKTDYTGTLLEKGRLVTVLRPGLIPIWGPHTGAHAAVLTEKTPDGRDWYVVGFGHQGAPDRNTLSGMNAYFNAIGEPGVRFLEFTI